MKKAHVLVIAFIISFSQAPLFSQTTEASNPKDFHFFAGINFHYRTADHLSSSSGTGFFAGVGYSLFALQLEASSIYFCSDGAGESIYGDIRYDREIDDLLLGIHFRYHVMKTQTLAPYVGAFAGYARMSQSDLILDNYDDPEKSRRMYYGPSVGIVIFPTKLFNVFVESRYIRYSSPYSGYNLHSYGQTGEWEKIEGNSINLNSFYFGGGVSCTIF